MKKPPYPSDGPRWPTLAQSVSWLAWGLLLTREDLAIALDADRAQVRHIAEGIRKAKRDGDEEQRKELHGSWPYHHKRIMKLAECRREMQEQIAEATGRAFSCDEAVADLKLSQGRLWEAAERGKCRMKGNGGRDIPAEMFEKNDADLEAFYLWDTLGAAGSPVWRDVLVDRDGLRALGVAPRRTAARTRRLNSGNPHKRPSDRAVYRFVKAHIEKRKAEGRYASQKDIWQAALALLWHIFNRGFALGIPWGRFA